MIYVILGAIIIAQSFFYWKLLDKQSKAQTSILLIGKPEHFTKEDEDNLSAMKNCLDLVIKYIDYQMQFSVSDLVETPEATEKAHVIRGKLQQLRFLRNEFSRFKKKILNDQ